ncbi:MAG TPA: APC family permease [Acidimicrobiales bacterium]|nr:APC family permease [Acidimicrobiales bacterium]
MEAPAVARRGPGDPQGLRPRPADADHERLPLTAEPSRLDRRVGLLDAVVVGLGAMIGAGVFAAVGPAAAAAGGGLLVGLVVAAAVAYCNAASSAQLAAVYPQAGGTYVYGRERLGPFWGHLAGWGFVVGKTASCAAMALTFGAYAAPQWRRPLALAAVAVLAAVNYMGIRKTTVVTRAIVAVVLAILAAVVAGTLGNGVSTANLGPITGHGWRAILESAGLLFFAFAGYARLATLGEEVADPSRTIPRAIPLALGLTLFVYAAVLGSALLAAGPALLAEARAPLAAALDTGPFAGLAPVVRVGATVACLGVLLSLLAGVSRTIFAMAANGEMPGWLGAVHPSHRVPHRAEIAVAALVVLVVLAADVRGAIGVSSFTVLAYYAIANAAAWTLPAHQRRWPRFVAGAGLVGCVILAFTLPTTSILFGSAVLTVGAARWWLRSRRPRRGLAHRP